MDLYSSLLILFPSSFLFFSFFAVVVVVLFVLVVGFSCLCLSCADPPLGVLYSVAEQSSQLLIHDFHPPLFNVSLEFFRFFFIVFLLLILVCKLFPLAEYSNIPKHEFLPDLGGTLPLFCVAMCASPV